MKEFTIGVLGGMGTYATIGLFNQYAQVFTAEKEWDRPRIIIDNRCTMPSRVRAYLYAENVEKLVNEITDSIIHFIAMGCTRIILACNTSHLFLPLVFKKIPEAEKRVISIIDSCVSELAKEKIDTVFLLASEGTIESGIYQNALANVGVQCVVPSKEEYSQLRMCIEAVKTNRYSDEIKRIFLQLVNRYSSCILGCTELPILVEKYQEEVVCKSVFDPLNITINLLKEEFEND